MQFNTMVCKGNMNFHLEAKKGGKPLARFPPLMPGPFLGEGSGQNRDYSNTTPGKLRKGILEISFFRTFRAVSRALQGHLAMTEVTEIVSPSKEPVTVACLPACLSRVDRAVLSPVSRV